jgi:hypothetical protein
MTSRVTKVLISLREGSGIGIGSSRMWRVLYHNSMHTPQHAVSVTVE